MVRPHSRRAVAPSLALASLLALSVLVLPPSADAAEGCREDSWIGGIDQRYPGDLGATADLVDLTLRIVGDELEAVFELNALYERDQTIAALAIDTDADPATGGGDWVDGDVDLGISSDGWEVLETFTTGDPEPT